VTALVICRFAHFLAAMLAFGASAYLSVAAPAALRNALAPALSRLVAAASVIAFVTAILWVALEAASMADDWSAASDPSMLLAALTETTFGRAWIVRLFLAAALVAVAFAARPGSASVTVVSGLTLASLALVGHAAMRTGLGGMAQRANHAVHLVAAGAWLGGLVPFAMCVAAYADERLPRDAVTAMTRFSFFGQFAVLALVLTGAANVMLISGHAPFPPTTPYRALLDLKLLIVALMVALALTNRFVVTPRLAPGAKAITVLWTTSLIEAALATIVVALVSVFALFDPN
jgi:putative copper resistance protein D